MFLLLAVRVRTHEVRIHVVNTTLCVHQKLVRLALNLNFLHDDSINHVNGLSFFLIVEALAFRAGPKVAVKVAHTFIQVTGSIARVVRIDVVFFLLVKVLRDVQLLVLNLVG